MTPIVRHVEKSEPGNQKMGKANPRISELTEDGHSNGRRTFSRFGHLPAKPECVLGEEEFHSMLTRERRRAERSRRPFALMLVDSRAVDKKSAEANFIERLTALVTGATRETDIIGWYEDSGILAVIFTEINAEDTPPVTEVLQSKLVTVLRGCFDRRLVSNLVVTVHLFPQSSAGHPVDRGADIKIHEDLSQKITRNRFPMVLKRGIDIVGSGILLLILSPVLAAIAVAIKLNSKGPIIFKQERVGQFGKVFRCLKFRTMYANNDSKIHRDYVQRHIAGKVEKENQTQTEPTVYKITNDPRVTPMGRFLRRTSFDEFPQFWNVLRGEMSLVGPRPPLEYEFEVYDFWHRRRVLEVKPGVTGLWQVTGRSRTSFDDMVRLDLRYSQGWSLWLDLKILLATPLAVLKGSGAF
jgi:lipopolysaccharide/colanic/teichoic acid biosynthesis glycosyltransferase